MKLLWTEEIFGKAQYARTFSETIVSGNEDESRSNPFSPDQMAGYTMTTIWVIINLTVAYLILKRFVFKPIIKLLEKRRESIETELKNAEENESAAVIHHREAEKAIVEARIEAAEILTDARLQADRQNMMILKSAREEAEALRARAEKDAERIRLFAAEHMRDDVAELAVAIAQKVIGNEIRDARKDDALREVHSKTGSAEVSND